MPPQPQVRRQPGPRPARASEAPPVAPLQRGAPQPTPPQPTVPDLITTIEAGLRRLKASAGGYGVAANTAATGGDISEMKIKIPVRYGDELIDAAVDLSKMQPDMVPEFLYGLANAFTLQIEEAAEQIGAASAQLVAIIKQSRESQLAETDQQPPEGDEPHDGEAVFAEEEGR